MKDVNWNCVADRVSLYRLWANQFRLLFRSAAHWLLATAPCCLTRLHVPHHQLGTLCLLLMEIGVWCQQRSEEWSPHLASSHPTEPLNIRS